MPDDEQTRDEIEEIVNDEQVQEAIIEAAVEEDEHKAKPVLKTKPKAKAKPKIEITKEPAESIEPIKEDNEPAVEEKSEKIMNLKKWLIAQTAI